MHGLVVTDCYLSNPEANDPATVYVSPPFSPLGQWKGFSREYVTERCDSVMDYYDSSRRKSAQDPYTATQEQRRRHQHQHQQQHGAGPTTDHFTTPASIHRFRQVVTSAETPGAIPSTLRAGNDPHLYSFTQAQQFGLASAPSSQTMHYSTVLQTPEAHRPPDPMQFTQYNPAAMYGMSQGSSQQQQSSQSQYDPAQYRGTGPGETMAHQLSMPHASQYFPVDQISPSASSTSDLKYTQLYNRPATYGQAGPFTLPTQIGYIVDPSTSETFPGYSQEVTEQGQEPAADLQGFYDSCNATLRSIFNHVYDKSLHHIGPLLLELSNRLLNHVEQLGLTMDDESQHDERVRMWDLYNHAWLSTLQAQFDMTQEMIQTRLSRPVMPLHELERLASELIRLCDDIERYGLVDYQMGVAEDEIIDLLLRCIALLEVPGDRDPDDDTGAAASSVSDAAQR